MRTRILGALQQVAQYGIPGEGHAQLLDLGTESFLRYWGDEVLEEMVSQGGSSCRFFEGAYGAGKTHLLGLFAEQAGERGLAVVRADLSQSLGLEDWRGITRHLLANLEVQIDGQRVRSLPQILAALRENGKGNRQALGSIQLPHSGFQAAIAHAVDSTPLDSEAVMLLNAFLLGDKPRLTELRAAGLRGVREPLTQRNAEQVLITVVNALYLIGLPGTLLLFDENERSFVVSKAPTKRVRVAANLLRRLIDGCVAGTLQGTLVVFAVLPGFLANCTDVYPALGQRLQLPPKSVARPAWRWPVLPLHAVSVFTSPEEFLRAAVQRMSELTTKAGGRPEGLSAQLTELGQAVLESHAGSGYRRHLMKALATATLERVI